MSNKPQNQIEFNERLNIIDNNNLNVNFYDKIKSLEVMNDKLKDENEQLKKEIKLMSIKLKEVSTFDYNKYRNDPNEYLFFKVWRDKTIRNIIFEHARLYKIHGKLRITSIQTLREFEHRTYLTELIINGCDVDEGDIPSSVTKLIANDSAFWEHSIPNSVKTLIGINKIIDISTLSVTDLEFSNDFNKTLTYSIPSTVTKLSLGTRYNYILDIGTLPLSITSLTLSDEFNQKLVPGCIPPNVKTIVFGSHFNQILNPGVLPLGLSSLSFNSRWISLLRKSVSSFNQKLDLGSLPKTLTFISFSSEFNNGGVQLDSGVLPSSLTYLQLGSSFTHSIKAGVLPSSLITLDIYNKNCLEYHSLPSSIKYIN